MTKKVEAMISEVHSRLTKMSNAIYPTDVLGADVNTPQGYELNSAEIDFVVSMCRRNKPEIATRREGLREKMRALVIFGKEVKALNLNESKMVTVALGDFAEAVEKQIAEIKKAGKVAERGIMEKV